MKIAAFRKRHRRFPRCAVTIQKPSGYTHFFTLIIHFVANQSFLYFAATCSYEFLIHIGFPFLENKSSMQYRGCAKNPSRFQKPKTNGWLNKLRFLYITCKDLKLILHLVLNFTYSKWLPLLSVYA